MKTISSEVLKNKINENKGEEIIVSKYELVMLVAKRAKQIAEKYAEEDPEAIIKPVVLAIDDLYNDNVEVEKIERSE